VGILPADAPNGWAPGKADWTKGPGGKGKASEAGKGAREVWWRPREAKGPRARSHAVEPAAGPAGRGRWHHFLEDHSAACHGDHVKEAGVQERVPPSSGVDNVSQAETHPWLASSYTAAVASG